MMLKNQRRLSFASFIREYSQQRASKNKQANLHIKPPSYKVFLLSWLGIYPLITGIFLLFGTQLSLLPLPIRTLLLTGVLVYLMTYVVMPNLMKLFHNWLYPNNKSRRIGK